MQYRTCYELQGVEVGKGVYQPTKAEFQSRVDFAERLLRQGLTSTTIETALRKKFNVRGRAARKYMTRVYERWDKDAKEVKPEMRLQKRVAQLEGVLELAMRRNPPDIKGATRAIALLCRVEGLFADKVEVATTVGVGVGLGSFGFQSQADVRERVEELKARLANGGPITGYIDAKSTTVNKDDGNGQAH